MTNNDFFPKKMNWNLDNMEIKTWSVEMAIRPIIKTVTSLVSRSTKTVKKKRKGSSKRARALVMAVEVATANFVEKGEMIAGEILEAREDILIVVEEVRQSGLSLISCSSHFAEDPCNSVKRANMVTAARELVSAVTRLLILADLADVHILLGKVNQTQEDLLFIRNTTNQPQLMEGMRRFELSSAELSKEAFKRQRELKDPEMRNGMAAARAVLTKHAPLLLTSSNVHVRYPDLKAAKQNRETLHRQICSAVKTIGEIGEGRHCPKRLAGLSGEDSGEELRGLVRDLQDCLKDKKGADLNNVEVRKNIKIKVEEIITKSSVFASLELTREERKEKIQNVCEELKKDVTERFEQVDNKIGSMQQVVDQLGDRVNCLQKLLTKTAVDQVSDLFINCLYPLNSLLAFAQRGKKEKVLESLATYSKQVDNFTALADLLCQVSEDQEGIRMVSLSVQHLQDLRTKLENAVLVLADIPESKAAQENVNMFNKAWVEQVKTFIDSVDDVISVRDFLKVSENHILKDVKACCQELQEGKEVKAVSEQARDIYQRSGRLCDVVSADMDRYEPGLYTEKVLEAVKILRLNLMPIFTKSVTETIKGLKNDGVVDENEFIDACRLLYDGVRDIRHAFLLTSDVEKEVEEEKEAAQPKKENKEDKPKKEMKTIKDAVKTLDTEEIKQHFTQEDAVYWTAVWSNPKVRSLLSAADIGGSQVEAFREEKEKLDKEVNKWEDSNNDIIVLAKYMCSIMSDMTDFIKGRGKIKTTSDVIEAAQKISVSGKQLDKLARKIADRCPESSTKNDLLAYLQRIALYCHQLNITSKVKADVHNVSGEFIVSGLDSATSLIQAARNLMNAVVLTVKASYVASRMYKGTDSSAPSSPSCPPSPVVVWKMRTPEKKPLVRREPWEESRARVRKGTDHHQSSPSKTLSLFQERRLSYSTSSSSIGSDCSSQK